MTHGPQGSRQHIWTFANADHNRGDAENSNLLCSCSGPNRIDWMFFNDMLWDSPGCGGDEPTCCNFNKPPWFCKTLPTSTSEDIELRSCYGDGIYDRNHYITVVDIFIK